MPRQRPIRGPRNSRYTLEDREFLPFEQSLATSQNIPFPSLTLPIASHVYVARSGRSFPNGDDPNWEHEWVFEGHIRAPYDVRAAQLGEIANQHCYEQNPLAGRGSTNESFLAADPLDYEAFDTDIAAAQGFMTKPTDTDLLDPYGAAAAAAHASLQNEALQRFLDPERARGDQPLLNDDGSVQLDENGMPRTQSSHAKKVTERLRANQSYDTNYLRSMGYDAVQDPSLRHPTKTKQGTPIPYFVDGTIAEAEDEPDPFQQGDGVNFEMSTDYWINWFGYPCGKLKTPVAPNDEDLAHSGSEFMRIITGTDLREQGFTLQSHQYEDAEIAPDHLNLLTYEANPGNVEQQGRDDAIRLRARQLVGYDFVEFQR